MEHSGKHFHTVDSSFTHWKNLGVLVGGAVVHGNSAAAEDSVALSGSFSESVTRGACLAVLPGLLKNSGFSAQEDPLSAFLFSHEGDEGFLRSLDLEKNLARELSGGERKELLSLLDVWREGLLTFDNTLPPATVPTGPFFLLLDQGVEGDEQPSKQSQAGKILEEACKRHTGIVPVVWSPQKTEEMGGGFPLFAPEFLARHPEVQVYRGVSPAVLLRSCVAVYTLDSPLGLEALLWEKPLHVFGAPWYAGRGCTVDLGEHIRSSFANRTQCSLECLLHRVIVLHSRYFQPECKAVCGARQAFQDAALQRKMRAELPIEMFALGFPAYKKAELQRFFPFTKIRHIRRLLDLPRDSTVCVWGAKFPQLRSSPYTGIRVLRLEDGFLRSVGLGARFAPPLSWVVDPSGIYFDARRPSGLEESLVKGSFSPGLLKRAETLRQRILETGITKYNVGNGTWQRPPNAARVLLVPGQVESDASIEFGCGAVRTNRDLLQAVRSENPGAHVLYKPHPDVLEGLRADLSGTASLSPLFDEMITDVPMARLLEEVDEVHTLTSLAGFEALIRGRRVVCYGTPFYAGWGLTEDRMPLARRGVKRSLEELLCATLLLYPTYVSMRTRRFVGPECTLEELGLWKQGRVPKGGKIYEFLRFFAQKSFWPAFLAFRRKHLLR